MDYETARTNMIEQQIRPWNVLEMQTLNALGAIRREDFVPATQRDLAFADVQIPLGNGEVMLEPKVSARLTESLHLSKTDRVLEIGTGTGYLTALLAKIAHHVTSVEIDPDLKAQAERNLGMSGISNIDLVLGDAHDGWGEPASFDAVLVSGSLAKVPETILQSLKDNGRLVGIEGHAPAMQAVLFINSSGKIVRTSLFETWAPRLKNAEDRKEFEF